MRYAFIAATVKSAAETEELQSRINDRAREGWEVHTFTVDNKQAFVLLHRKPA